MKKKKNKKLYNFIIPPYVATLFSPLFVLVCLAGNFLIDSLVMLVISWAVFGRIDFGFYKKRILKAWLLGFAADFIALLFMLLCYETGHALWNSFPQDSWMNSVARAMALIAYDKNIGSIIFMIIAIALAAAAIYLFNYFNTFRGSGMSKKQRVLSSLAFAVFTAPYTLLLPLEKYAELFSWPFNA